MDLGAPRPLGADGRAVFETAALGVGQHTITAHYGGDSIYPANVSNGMSVTVARASTTTTVSSSANPSVAGQQVTYTAVVAPVAPGAGTPGGTVAFSEGGATIAGCGAVAVVGGVATCQTTPTGPGQRAITAAYAGNGQFLASTSAALTQVVNEVPALASTSTTLRSSLNPSVFGQAVTLTATVAGDGTGTPTGSVTYMVGVTPLGTAAVGSGGAAVFRTDALTVGSHAVTAVYAGDDRFEGSTSAALTQVVTITPAALCSLTQKYVQGSAKYAALGRLQRIVVDVLFRAACTVTAAVTPKMNARQKAAAITAHKAAVDNLVRQGWLTAQQGETLKGLASAL